MVILEIFFWFILFVLFYPYFVYPACLCFLALVNSNPVRKENIKPTVSLAISAFNEENVIGKKIENALALDYPKNLLKEQRCSVHQDLDLHLYFCFEE